MWKIRIDRFVKTYSNAIDKNPIRTKMTTCFGIACLGDFLCQATMRYRYRNDFGKLTELNLHEWSPVRTIR